METTCGGSGMKHKEPVGWLDAEMSQAYTVDELPDASGTGLLPLYTAPPKREWVGLTGDEVYECWKTGDVVAAVEAKLREKNHG